MARCKKCGIKLPKLHSYNKTRKCDKFPKCKDKGEREMTATYDLANLLRLWKRV